MLEPNACWTFRVVLFQVRELAVGFAAFQRLPVEDSRIGSILCPRQGLNDSGPGCRTGSIARVAGCGSNRQIAEWGA